MIEKYLLEIKDNLVFRYGLKPIEIQFKDVHRGRARCKTGKITIPNWALERDNSFAIYYVIHEVCHFICREVLGNGSHSLRFLEIEKPLLEEYNIIPSYAKVYPKALYNKEGKTLWCKKKGKF